MRSFLKVVFLGFGQICFLEQTKLQIYSARVCAHNRHLLRGHRRKRNTKAPFSPHIFAFLIRKMKHESFKSHLNQHKQRQQKSNILYQHTFKVEKQHSLNKRHFSSKHAPQRTSCDLKLLHPPLFSGIILQ